MGTLVAVRLSNYADILCQLEMAGKTSDAVISFRAAISHPARENPFSSLVWHIVG